MQPQAGREQSGRRPAVVLSQQIYNRRSGLVVLCPVTSRVKGYPFEVALPKGGAVTGVALADQIRNVDWQARHAEFIERLDGETMDEIWAKLQALLSPEPEA